MKNGRTAKSRNTRLILAGTVALGLAGGVIWLRRTPSSEDVARRLDACFRSYDGGCLLANTWPGSMKMAGWTEESLNRFLQTEIRPIVETAQSGELKLVSKPDQGLLTATREYTTSNGNKAAFLVQVFISEPAPKTDSITPMLLIFCVDAKEAWKEDDVSRFERRSAWMKLGKEKLEPLGVKGFEQRNKAGVLELRPWADALALNDQRLQILRQSSH